MINLIMALQAEARPLIDAFKLKQQNHDTGFTVYASPSINLIISGIGQLPAAMATAYLQGRQQQPNTPWLNIGIAGSGEHTIGQDVLAHRIRDAASNQVFYPSFCFEAPCPTGDIVTVDAPESHYSGHAVYDMEAAGFATAASRFTTCELIHSYKVISDNHDNPPHTLTAKDATELIAAKTGTINQIMEELDMLTGTVQALQQKDTLFDTFMAKWHFTSTQQKQLQQLLRRWKTLTEKPLETVLDVGKARSSKDLLKHIETAIDKLPIVF